MPRRRALYDLLDLYNAAPPAARDDIAQEIERRFGVEQAILVLDMSGFTRTVQQRGIYHYLGMIRRMQVVTRPLVERMGGAVVKYEADNLFALFPAADPALEMAEEARRQLRRAGCDGEPGIEVSIGIAWGRLLHIPEADMFGNAVNVACKLGEDIAVAGEILLDESARAALSRPERWRLEPAPASISGVDIAAWRVRDTLAGQLPA